MNAGLLHLAFHPGAWLIAGGLVAALFRRQILASAVGVSSAVMAVIHLPRLPRLEFHSTIAGFRLTWYRGDDLSLLFTLVFAVVVLVGLVYGWHRMRRGEVSAALCYAGSAIGTVLAGDWVTFFVFWEGMAITSLALIWQGGTERSRRAGMRYLLVHAVGGALLFLGILLHLAGGGAPELRALAETSPPFWLILTAVCLNAAVPPLHAWLTDAYPEASTSGAVFLSAFTTKTAVYALLRLFPGTDLLVPLGVAMALYGVAFAILENDIRRLLGYHIVSQVGYMVAAVGLGTPLALNGAASHAFSHILYKALLFMGAGAIIEATGFRRLSDLGGIGHRMRLCTAMYIVGALSISGWPLFNGFVSKSMIVSAAGEEHFLWTELMLTLAAVGTFFSVGLKLPWFAFFGRRRQVAVTRLPPNLIIAMMIGGGLCLLYGVLPDLLYRLLPYRAEYQPFTLDHVVSSCQLLLGTGLFFALIARRLTPAPHLTLDFDWAYRGPPGTLGRTVVGALAGLKPLATVGRQRLVAGAEAAVRKVALGRTNPAAPEGFSFRAPIGWTVFFAAMGAALLLAALSSS